MGLLHRFLGRRPADSSSTVPSPATAATAATADGEPDLVGFFTQDHQDCDARWPEVEAAVGTDRLAEAFGRFNEGIRQHLRMEEEHLFPAFEQATGMQGHGPTAVMRGEHEQMRGLLDQMRDALKAGDENALLDLGDTLMMLIQQHNVKEEGMLYPMAAEVLADQWPEIHSYVERLLPAH